MTFREAHIRHYPTYVRRHQGIMQSISTNEYLEKLQNYTGFGRAIGFTRKDYHQLLEYLANRVTYTTGYITRHEDPIEILEYGYGRCGEFAIAFTALCLANAWEARLVVDASTGEGNGDHIWTEILIDGTWLHIDPTQWAVDYQNQRFHYLDTNIDNPSMYEKQWGKELTEVWGITADFAERVEMNYQWEEEHNDIEEFHHHHHDEIEEEQYRNHGCH